MLNLSSHEIDSRDKKQLLAQMKALARQYTPEWRMDEESVDMGTALALLYADMAHDLLQKLNSSLEHNRIAFLNEIRATLLPAIAAKGYVVFGTPAQLEYSAQVSKGARLLADTMDSEGANLIFETTDDVRVTPAALASVFTVCGTRDTIFCQMQQGETQEPFLLFGSKGENLQRHELVLEHTGGFHMPHGGTIKIQLVTPAEETIAQPVMQAFADPEKIGYYYWTGEDWQSFGSAYCGNNCIHLELREDAGWVEQEDSLRMLWRIEKVEAFRHLYLKDIRIDVARRGLLPEAVYTPVSQQDRRTFFPFGERPAIYNDVYFTSREVFEKKGANVTLRFDMDFMRIPIQEQENGGVQWKVVMKRSQIEPEQEYDITVRQVIWEYFNGVGWVLLFPGGEYADIFFPSEDTKGKRSTISFFCPADIAPALVGAEETYAIRARIIKLDNAYRTRGYYVAPYLSEVYLDYNCEEKPFQPSRLTLRGNMEETILDLTQAREQQFALAKTPDEGCPVCLLGFTLPPHGGPVKLLFVTEDILNKTPPLEWEYLSRTGWKRFSPMDETENLRRTGIVTWSLDSDFQQTRLFGEELYWIRLKDRKDAYWSSSTYTLPIINQIYINAVRIINLETIENEMHTIEDQMENQEIKLAYDTIASVEVWNNEVERCNLYEIKQLEQQGEAQLVFSEAGVLEEVWVKWHEIIDFMRAKQGERCYIVDRNRGSLFFSDGRRGAIPVGGEGDTLRVTYTVGGGQLGNVEAGDIQTLNETIGFIDSVTNPIKTYGGCDQETVHESFRRNGEMLKHRFRCVTAEDYEELAKTYCRNIRKVKCYGGVDGRGNPQSGAVTLVVLAEDADSCPDAFEAIRQRLWAELPPCMPPHVVQERKFYVVPAKFAEIRVRVSATVASYNSIFTVKEQIQKRLDSFLDPVCGNFNANGWRIGEFPKMGQLRVLLKGIIGMEFVSQIVMDTYICGRFGKQAVTLERKDTLFMLPASGTHDLLLQVERNRLGGPDNG